MPFLLDAECDTKWNNYQRIHEAEYLLACILAIVLYVTINIGGETHTAKLRSACQVQQSSVRTQYNERR